jgi:hypothetical protein
VLLEQLDRGFGEAVRSGAGGLELPQQGQGLAAHRGLDERELVHLRNTRRGVQALDLGLWSKVGDIASSAGTSLLHAGEDVVNGLASFGNAMVQHPGDTAAMVGGMALTAVSAGGEGLGVALDATGVGAVAGVPLNAVSAAGIAAGVGITAAAGADLAQHAIAGGSRP